MEKLVLYWSKNDNISQDCYRLIHTNKVEDYIEMINYELMVQKRYIAPKWLRILPTLAVASNEGVRIFEGRAAKVQLEKKIKNIQFLMQYNDKIIKREKESEKDKPTEVVEKRGSSNSTVDVDLFVTKRLINDANKYRDEHSQNISTNMNEDEKHYNAMNNPSIEGKSKNHKKVGEFSSSNTLIKSLGIKINNDGQPEIQNARNTDLFVKPKEE